MMVFLHQNLIFNQASLHQNLVINYLKLYKIYFLCGSYFDVFNTLVCQSRDLFYAYYCVI